MKDGSRLKTRPVARWNEGPPGGRAYMVELSISVDLREKEPGKLVLAITGETRHGSRYLGGGQNIDDLRYVLGPTFKGELLHDRARLEEILKAWERYHLNDMRPGCVHQTAAGWRSCPGHYGTDESEDCLTPKKEPTAADYPLGHPFVIGASHFPGEYEGPYINPDKAPCEGCRRPYADHLTPEALARHRAPKKHYRCKLDRLSQPCPTCGYKYGTAWLYEELPADVVALARAW